MADPCEAAVQRAVRAASTALLARDQTIVEVVARLSEALASIAPSDTTPREAVAALKQSRKQQMLDALARYQAQGRGSSSVMLVARDFAADKHDDVELENLRRNLDRWRKGNPDNVRKPPPKHGRTKL